MTLSPHDLQPVDTLSSVADSDPLTAFPQHHTTTMISDDHALAALAAGSSHALDYILLGIVLSIIAFLWVQ
jgi:hypothetical protein